MFNSQTLDVLVGIVFIYCLVGIICTAVKEALESLFKTRASYLEYGIRELLHDPDGNGLARTFFQHPLIRPLFPGEYQAGSSRKRPGPFTSGRDWPSYILAANFTRALFDIAAHGADAGAASAAGSQTAVDLATIRAGIGNLGNPAVERAMRAALDHSQGDIEQALKHMEQWYDSAMDRVSGWYRRSTHRVLFCISLIVTIALNINSLTLIHYLSVNAEARARIVTSAQTASSTDSTNGLPTAVRQLEELALPIGWNSGSIAAWNKESAAALTYELTFGWLMTAFAGTLGAPFWFDILGRITAIRSTIKPRDKSPQGTTTTA